MMMRGRQKRMVAAPAMGTAIAALLGGGTWAYRRVRARRTRLHDQVALVTGGSRGLGFLLAKELADEGCRLVICARDPVGLERARRELEARGANVLAVACDITDRVQVEELVEAALQQFGRIDLLVNNAGVIQVGPLGNMNIVDFHYAMAVNFWGAVYTTLAVLPEMRSRGRGRIVNITSIGGKVAVPHLLPYDCAKFAALGFSEGLRAELARDGITVTTVVPGLMRTGSHSAALFKGRQASEYLWFSTAARTPLFAMNATRAARRIVQAAKLGTAEVVIGWQAQLLRVTKGLFPGITARVLGMVNRLLPKPAADGPIVIEGYQIATEPGL